MMIAIKEDDKFRCVFDVIKAAVMTVAERNLVAKCLVDMQQVLEPDAVSAVTPSLRFQKLVTSYKDALEALPAEPVNGEWEHENRQRLDVIYRVVQTN